MKQVGYFFLRKTFVPVSNITENHDPKFNLVTSLPNFAYKSELIVFHYPLKSLKHLRLSDDFAERRKLHLDSLEFT